LPHTTLSYVDRRGQRSCSASRPSCVGVTVRRIPFRSVFLSLLTREGEARKAKKNAEEGMGKHQETSFVASLLTSAFDSLTQPRTERGGAREATAMPAAAFPGGEKVAVADASTQQ